MAKEDEFYNIAPTEQDRLRVMGAYKRMFGNQFGSRLNDTSASALVSGRRAREREEEEIRNRGSYLLSRFGAGSQEYGNYLAGLRAQGIGESGKRMMR